MHEVLVNRLGGLSLPRKSVVRLTDHPDMTFVASGMYYGDGLPYRRTNKATTRTMDKEYNEMLCPVKLSLQ